MFSQNNRQGCRKEYRNVPSLKPVLEHVAIQFGETLRFWQIGSFHISSFYPTFIQKCFNNIALLC